MYDIQQKVEKKNAELKEKEKTSRKMFNNKIYQ